MRRAIACLFTLAALTMAFAQTPANDGNQASQAPNTVTPGQPANPNQQAAPAATQQTPEPGSAGNIERLDAGTEIHAALDTPLSTRTSKPGDRFTASMTDVVRANSGAVVIPSGAHIEGEVAEAEEGKTLAALRGKGALSLRFRNIVMPNGQTLPLTATLVSVHDTRGGNTRKANGEGQMQSSARSKDTAQDAGIGAGMGSAAGLVFGVPLKGLAIGSLAGGGYVVATKGKEVNLPAQTGMIIRLDQPISWTIQ